MLLVMSLAQEHAALGATFDIRNPKPYSPAIEITE
ncbi:hypothetical protein BCD96_002790 [Clostridium beijerinckii]|nr:hypothetical protein [Clostridium beijerinckii]NRT35464.1 hypothetical protein [Clostridium beijerinckii]NRT45108.1 hypothetical protein [Clostridium beijerinckii]NRU38824.1 hypothetical protein [Clostridium beijerinckii]NRZ20896.1 hypothetical protein [Clostridium beijerinckii]